MRAGLFPSRGIHRVITHLVDIFKLRIGLFMAVTALAGYAVNRDGRQVLLCWKVGERSLEFWHELDAGYSGRQRVDDDGPWDDG